MPQKVNLAEKLSFFSERFQPRIVGEVGDMHVKVVKLEGEFVWHHHENEDEMFLVLKGRFRIRFRDGELSLDPGELVIVPRGVEHCPYADEEVHVMLFEPKSTVNTGTAGGERTFVPTPI
ncbi:MAG TPA: cupin domain-containing protein [Thermoanaerobaculia bacterium]|nr:cupin domain-containing protein [Thermoanaerobaculia bacterium]